MIQVQLVLDQVGQVLVPQWFYTPAEIRTLTPVLKNVERRVSKADLRDVSPLFGSRRGLDTAEDPIVNVASKLAKLVAF